MPSKRRGVKRKDRRPVVRKPRSAANQATHVWEVISQSPRRTNRLGRAVGAALRGGETLALIGAMGTGKTTLVRGIAVGIGASPASVSSPTFVFIHEYRGRLLLAHVDLYRLEASAEVESIGLTDYFSGSTVVAIEWADKYPMALPEDRLQIRLRHRTVGSRSISLTATGPTSVALLAETRHLYVRTGRKATPKPKRKASS